MNVNMVINQERLAVLKKKSKKKSQRMNVAITSKTLSVSIYLFMACVQHKPDGIWNAEQFKLHAEEVSACPLKTKQNKIILLTDLTDVA